MFLLNLSSDVYAEHSKVMNRLKKEACHVWLVTSDLGSE